jgi:hypothetical protein
MTTITLVTTASTASSDSLPRRSADYAFVAAAWALAVLAATLFPLDHPQLKSAALFVHLMSMAVGFGAVIMIDVYGLLCLLGRRTLSDVAALAAAAHGVIALGVGGLLASGIALRPDMTSPLARFKLLLVLILMLNGTAAQRMIIRLKQNLPARTQGESIPWAVFQRLLGLGLISQATWWGAITIGFLTNANRT